MPEFRYIAFDQESQTVIAHDTHAVYALRRADEQDPAARVYIIDAGALGREIWRQQMSLPEAEQFILKNLSDSQRPLEAQIN